MTQKEEEKYMQSLTNEELIACLHWYRRDPDAILIIMRIMNILLKRLKDD